MDQQLEDDQYNKLSSGVSNLKQAIPRLIITVDEQKALKAILARNESILEKEKAARNSEKKKRALHERLIREKRERDLKEMHSKSGFTDYLVRVPGSYEGGKS